MAVSWRGRGFWRSHTGVLVRAPGQKARRVGLALRPTLRLSGAGNRSRTYDLRITKPCFCNPKQSNSVRFFAYNMLMFILFVDKSYPRLSDAVCPYTMLFKYASKYARMA